MSFVTAQPESLAAAAEQLAGVGAVLAAENAAAAPATTAVPPAAADDVSALIAAKLTTQAVDYQTVGSQALAVHQALVAALTQAATAYQGTEAANAALTG